MKFRINREIKAGILFIVALAVLIWGLMYLKGLDIFRPQTKVFAVYEKINGLVKSNQVTINGLQVGQVSDIYFSPDNSGKIVVELIITVDYHIPRNSVARIFNSSLIGNKEVEIVLGDSREIIREGDTLLSTVDASLSEEVNRQLGPLKIKAESILGTLDTVVTAVKQILNEGTQRDLRNAISQVSITIENFAGITHKIDTLLGSQKTRLIKIMSNVESISANLNENNDRISNILQNFSTLSDSLAKTNIPATFKSINQSLAEINTVFEKINNSKGSIGLLINDDKLYNELTKAAKDLNLLLEDVKANPSKYVKVSVF